ncbi:hypothetical protein DFH28DRAFT_892100 [Melampsora americana]|nr:hypothetical protein DFH28DRAFT_892100 [Melampsora americana]
MSEIVKSRILNFLIHLTPDVNPYQATADHLASFLLPCRLPSWSRYVELVILAQFIIMFFQSSYLLYLRRQTKRIYHIGLNEMGLIELDRANHCGICYFLYSIIAVIEIILEPFVQSGHLDQGWPDFILGIQFTLTNACAGIILWLAICHCLLVQGYVSRRSTPVGQLLPTTVSRALNVLLAVILLGPTVTIIIAYYQVAIEYHRIRQLVMPVIHIFRQKASSTCSLDTCSTTHMLPELLSLIPASHHIDLLVHYTRIGISSYIFFDLCILIGYVPLLYRLYQSFKAQRRLFRSSQPQQDKVFANTLIEFAIITFSFFLSVSSITLVQEGQFIFNPRFFLNIRIGINGVISNLGNIALFLIICSNWNDDVDPPKVHIPTLPSLASGGPKSDENTSPCYPYL